MRNLILFYFCIFISCSSHYSPEIEKVLQLAGNNRKELETTLKHYSRNPADSLKLRAAEFLIINMPNKYSVYYDAPWRNVATVRLRWTSSSDKRKVLDTYKLGEQVIQEDIKHITAEYLINNIDLAFKVWRERPWGKHIPFDAFCEDILPYRIDTEPLENWREKVLICFAFMDTVLNQSTISAVEACSKINELLPQFRIDNDFPHMSFSQLVSSTRGTCDNMAALAAFSMRALGIPVTVEFTPKWIELPTGHAWNAVRDSTGNYVSFMGVDSGPYQPHQGNTLKKSKVYRKTFAIQQNLPTDNIPSLLRKNKNIKDVSAEYEDCRDTVIVHLKYPPETPVEYVYLANKYKDQMYPVAWAAIKKDSTVTFTSIGNDVLYFPLYYYAHNKQTPAGDSFRVDTTGNKVVLNSEF
jgi:hypothetical protein